MVVCTRPWAVYRFEGLVYFADRMQITFREVGVRPFQRGTEGGMSRALHLRVF